MTGRADAPPDPAGPDPAAAGPGWPDPPPGTLGTDPADPAGRVGPAATVPAGDDPGSVRLDPAAGGRPADPAVAGVAGRVGPAAIVPAERGAGLARRDPAVGGRPAEPPGDGSGPPGMGSGAAVPERAAGPGRVRRGIVLGVLAGLLLVVGVASIGLGAVRIGPDQVVAILARRVGIHLGVGYSEQQDAVLWAIRLPRVVLAVLVGSGLGVAGAALQGIFRNPLADPGLIGVSSGAAIGAAAMIVLGTTPFGLASVPLAAFAGGLAAAALVYTCARYQGRTEVVTLLLCGIAVNTIAGAVIGLLIVVANDSQLRDIVFWTLGSLGSATWPTVGAVAPLIVVAVLILPRLARSLDLMALGEREAGHLGVATERVRIAVVVLAALATGAGVAVAGVIGFVGLVVPHIVRLLTGPGHRIVLPASALGGAVVLLGADLAARTVAVPREIPLGVVTALVGGPFFLALVVRTRRRHGGWG